MPPGQHALPRHLLGKRKSYDEEGCRVCGTQRSSSFRRCLTTGHRLCNSCHCKLYRRKRKEAAVVAATDRAGHSDGSVSSAAALLPHELLGSASGDGSGADGPTAIPVHMQEGSWALVSPVDQAEGAFEPGPLASAPPPSTPPSLQPPSPSHPPALPIPFPSTTSKPTPAPKPAKPHPTLAQLQWRVLEEEGLDVATTLQCALHAQAATAGCLQRAVLGVLPLLELRLPNDPPGMRHAVSCLIEAVLPVQTRPVEQEADSEAAAAAAAAAAVAAAAGTTPCPSPAPAGAPPAATQAAAAGAVPHVVTPRRMTRQQQRKQAQACLRSHQAVVRLTVFGAAGAVARWHQGPAISIASPRFSPVNGEPMWSSGPAGFCLCFPGAASPQVELFNAIRVYAASVGSAALLRPTLDLAPVPVTAPPPFSAAFDDLSLAIDPPGQEGGAGVGDAPPAWALPPSLAPRPGMYGGGMQPTNEARHAAHTGGYAQQQQQQQQAVVQEQEQEPTEQEWQSLQALLLQEQEPLPGFGAGTSVVPEPSSDAAGFSSGAVTGTGTGADPLACLGLSDDLCLACSLPSEPFFDTACLDFFCAADDGR